MGTEIGGDRLRRVRRQLALSAIIVSSAVLLFAVFVINTTDDMTRSSERMYETGYSAIFVARTLQSDLLRVSDQLSEYLEAPASESARETLTSIYAWERQVAGMMDSIDVLMTEQQREELTAALRSAYEEANKAVALAQSGKSAEAARICSESLLPHAKDIDEQLEAIIKSSSSAMEAMSEDIREMNEHVNANALLLAVAVIALCVVSSILSGRAIERENEKAFRQELLFNMIGRNADDVFEIYSFGDQRLGYVSENVLRIFGFTSDDYLANNAIMRECIDPEDRKTLFEMYFNPRLANPASFDFRYTNPVTGRKQIFHSNMYPVTGAGGKLEYHILLTRDVTNDRQSQARLQKALDDATAADKSRREFLSRMSHEVRTPINGIIGMQALAESSIDDREKLERYLHQISVSARHLLGLVNDVLDMSKIESGKLELQYAPFDLKAMVQDLILLISARIEEKKQTLTVEYLDCDETMLVGDELRLRQVLLNFLSNANKYTDEGGRIRMIARQSPPKVGFVHMVFSVEDNGRGIPRDEVHKIFLPFERGSAVADRTSGTGLGLAISKNVIEEMGGTIWAESVEGEGSTFSFNIALGIAKKEPEQIIPSYIEVEEEDTGPIRLLVAEDNDINMEIARELLLKDGFVVEEALNGKEAVDMFEAAPAGWYSAVLMDIQMPVMDGRMATKLIRESTARDGSRIAILAMTADPFAQEDLDAVHGFTGCIGKPIDADGMAGAIMEAIQDAQQKRKPSEDPKTDG